MYNLADGAYTNGTSGAAAASLSGTTGAQSYSNTFDLSGFSIAPNDMSGYDYLVLGVSRKIDGATAPSVQMSNLLVSLNSKGKELVPFEKWISDRGLTDATLNDDPDSDGKPNLLEFAFGTDPAVSNGSSIAYAGGVTPGLPLAVVETVTATTVDFRAAFGRRKDWAAAGLTYTVQFSSDLTEWVDSADTPLEIESGSGDIDAVYVPYPLAIPTSNGYEKAQFFRLSISQN